MRLKVRTKLILLILLPLVASAGVAGLAINELQSVSHTATRLTEERLIPVWRLNRIARHYTQGIVDLAHKTRGQMLFWGEAKKALEEAKSTINTEWGIYRSGPLTEREKEILADGEEALAKAEAAIAKLEGFIDEKSSYSMGSFVDLELYPSIEPILAVLDELVQVQGMLANEASTEAQAVADKAQLSLLITLALATVLVIAFGVWLYTGITNRLSRMLNTITTIEKNKDLTVRADLPMGDEFGDMGRRFDRMMTEIGEMIRELQTSANQVYGAAEELVLVSEKTQSQASEQQEQINHMVQGMDEVNQVANTVLTNVAHANSASTEADGAAQQGNSTVMETMASISGVSDQVQETASGMYELKEAGENIGSVLAVIKGIAEQTNLLALNAAIEAARAGEQGRGFAVVADEVRQLASRTSESTKEIQEIIENIQQGTQRAAEQMESGERAARESVEQARLAGQSIEAIITGVSLIDERTRAIENASQNQQAIVGEVGVRVQRVDELASQTAELSTQATGTSRQVAELSRTLEQRLQLFCA
ncbi:methyl-accepting chemotaxis protein [Maricurvus nonylphenolicus]|uniref:methyl-accepting chemotaxis protein n=1 Tax=Maricurvus nonylphenolicus TaxID=1008307 RepID=UPI0036F1C75D